MTLVDYLCGFLKFVFVIKFLEQCSLLVFYMSGMKVYITDEKELIMEPLLKWAGNPNITIVIKAFGLRATVQVFDCLTVNEERYFYLSELATWFQMTTLHI